MKLVHSRLDPGSVDPRRVVRLLEVDHVSGLLNHRVVFVVFDQVREGVKGQPSPDVVLVVLLDGSHRLVDKQKLIG